MTRPAPSTARVRSVRAGGRWCDRVCNGDTQDPDAPAHRPLRNIPPSRGRAGGARRPLPTLGQGGSIGYNREVDPASQEWLPLGEFLRWQRNRLVRDSTRRSLRLGALLVLICGFYWWGELGTAIRRGCPSPELVTGGVLVFGGALLTGLGGIRAVRSWPCDLVNRVAALASVLSTFLVPALLIQLPGLGPLGLAGIAGVLVFLALLLHERDRRRLL